MPPLSSPSFPALDMVRRQPVLPKTGTMNNIPPNLLSEIIGNAIGDIIAMTLSHDEQDALSMWVRSAILRFRNVSKLWRFVVDNNSNLWSRIDFYDLKFLSSCLSRRTAGDLHLRGLLPFQHFGYQAAYDALLERCEQITTISAFVFDRRALDRLFSDAFMTWRHAQIRTVFHLSLRELCLSNFDSSPSVINDVAVRLPALQSLRLFNVAFTSLPIDCRDPVFPSLETVQIRFNGFTADELQSLADVMHNAQRLRSLTLIGDDGEDACKTGRIYEFQGLAMGPFIHSTVSDIKFIDTPGSLSVALYNELGIPVRDINFIFSHPNSALRFLASEAVVCPMFEKFLQCDCKLELSINVPLDAPLPETNPNARFITLLPRVCNQAKCYLDPCERPRIFIRYDTPNSSSCTTLPELINTLFNHAPTLVTRITTFQVSLSGMELVRTRTMNAHFDTWYNAWTSLPSLSSFNLLENSTLGVILCERFVHRMLDAGYLLPLELGNAVEGEVIAMNGVTDLEDDITADTDEFGGDWWNGLGTDWLDEPENTLFAELCALQV
ncbi:hypothetical protein BXZ70DRAFT_910894 [Cristinia sonorae]|uniref:F-box domain-containing protein n=1 Tax=Cristinia sonorae TaxID=1940300 RepID=A0A8K0UFM6_9AGAR|nr:hypothetical protein BXZ70DRAFT_910894 [Cristinia sonorae]